MVASDAEDPGPEGAALFAVRPQWEWPPLELGDGSHDLEEDFLGEVFRVGFVADAGEAEAIEGCDVRVVEPPDRPLFTFGGALDERAFFGDRQVRQRGAASECAG